MVWEEVSDSVVFEVSFIQILIDCVCIASVGMSVEVNDIISHIVLEFNFLIIIVITVAKTV